ncbi:MAG: trigger factor [Phycisphaeraceae bacterium]|nr:trigger factor [Phycisphaeraceae bacterium]
MADSETTTLTPTVDVADAGPARKRLTITIPAENVDDRIETSFGALQMEAAVPGFRRGRVPRALLEKRFGTALLNEARSQLLADAYSKALEEKGLKPVSQPELETAAKELSLARGKSLTFTVDVEVVPEFELPKLEEVPVRRPTAEVTAEHVEAELRRNQYRFGTPSRIDGPFQPLDRLLGRVVVNLNESSDVFFESNEALVVVPDVADQGRGQLLGLLFEDLGPRLEGHSVGEELIFETTGPMGHEREELRGAKVKIAFTIREAERIEPATPESLAEQFGLGSSENLREQIRIGLERRRDNEQRAAMREQVFRYLVDAVNFDLPEKLSQAQVQRNLDIMRMEMLHRGMEGEEVERRLAELRSASEDDTRRRLKLFFILARLAEHFKVEVSEAEVNGRISQIAMSRNMRPDQVRLELERSNRINDVALSIREAKTADRIIDRAIITDVDAASWNAELEAARKGATAPKEAKAASKAAGKGRGKSGSPE